MKKLMGALKGLNFKELLLNHGEKLGFGLALLLVLLSLAGTEWSRYAKTPQEIIGAVKEAKTKIEASVWPEEKRLTFAPQDYTARAQDVRGPLQLARHEFSTNMWWPLYRKQELAKEPELLAVVDLIATPGVMAFGTVPKTATDGLMTGADGEAMVPAAEADDVDREFAPVSKSAASGALGSAGFGPQSGPGGAHGGSPGMPAMPMPAGPMTGGPGGAHAGGSSDLAGGMAGEYGMMGGAAAMSSRGERFVAVRGIWPIWQQMEKFQRALNLQSTSDARNYLQLLDFVLERQTAVAGSDPWTGPWDVVDKQRALDVLGEAYDFAIDPVDPQITDVTITMPLPARLVGQWTDHATHPKIENFVLSPAELDRETKLQAKMVEEYEKYRLKEDSKKVKPRGFSNMQRNIRGMTEQMFGSEYGDQITMDMGSYMASDPNIRMSLPDLKSRMMAIGRLVLFRYFDFDVRPGYAYRYR
ncbi:MAG TPA: hypothetical protein VM165_25460, partial [Planctomycetaceae bacterium]|nr:hypothetical protein [Planctomycetaceae bacterium]